ncbi:MAG TPA: hypothetical protein VKR05_03275 [Candidatus Cybelea sp.]|nr:hypothetical protein [Candidatus Cybelea sp.]
MNPCRWLPLALCLCVLAAQPVPAAQPSTTAHALSSLDGLLGTWHCVDGKVTETDVYTRRSNAILDTDSRGGTTVITFDSKRQKWVVFAIGSDGFSASEGTVSPHDRNKATFLIVYPHASNKPFVVDGPFGHTAGAKMTIGTMSCVKM